MALSQLAGILRLEHCDTDGVGRGQKDDVVLLEQEVDGIVDQLWVLTFSSLSPYTDGSYSLGKYHAWAFKPSESTRQSEEGNLRSG